MRVRWDAPLVAEAVFLASRERELRGDEAPVRRWRAAAERAWEPEPRGRADALQAVDAAVFAALELGAPIAEALRRRRGLHERDGELVVLSAPGPAEGADLSATGEVVLRLRPERLAGLDPLQPFLDRELVHAEDLIDPAFGYEPGDPFADAPPAARRLLRERYRVLWSLTVDLRLAREGRLAKDVAAAAALKQAFPRLSPEAAEGAAAALAGSARPSHAELVAWCRDPDGIPGATGVPASAAGPVPSPGDPCPLCGFTTFAWAGDICDRCAEVVA